MDKKSPKTMGIAVDYNPVGDKFEIINLIQKSDSTEKASVKKKTLKSKKIQTKIGRKK